MIYKGTLLYAQTKFILFIFSLMCLHSSTSTSTALYGPPAPPPLAPAHSHAAANNNSHVGQQYAPRLHMCLRE